MVVIIENKEHTSHSGRPYQKTAYEHAKANPFVISYLTEDGDDYPYADLYDLCGLGEYRTHILFDALDGRDPEDVIEGLYKAGKWGMSYVYDSPQHDFIYQEYFDGSAVFMDENHDYKGIVLIQKIHPANITYNPDTDPTGCTATNP